LDFASPNGVDGFPPEDFGGRNYFAKASPILSSSDRKHIAVPNKYKMEVERTISRLEKLRETKLYNY
jgi:hypothetical protein